MYMPMNGGGGTKGIMYADDATAAKYMGNDVIEKPLGTRRVPARTCKHLALANPHFKDGMYWIDPNGGRIDDAVKVYCRISNHLTCIQPKTDKFEPAAHLKEHRPGHTWFGELKGIKRFDYQIEPSQLTFLKMLSSDASQRITVECKGLAVVGEAGEDAAVLFADNDKRLYTKDQVFKYNTVRDECRYMKDSLAETVLEVNSRSQRLPIRDIALANLGSPNQLFGLKLGEVCFG